MTDKSDHVMEAMSPLGLHPLVHENAIRDASPGARSAISALKSPELDKQRDEAEQEAARTLDKEAIAAVQETLGAVHALSRSKADAALEAIERATGKIDIVLARNPEAALVPIDLEVLIIDNVPEDWDESQIANVADVASLAIDELDFPTARSMLRRLMSEVRVRTYQLPLGTYPAALKEAARLLADQKTKDAHAVLLTALGALVMMDRIISIPLLLAREHIDQAQAAAATDKGRAQQLLEKAKKELERSRSLGYAGYDPEYLILKDEIAKSAKQLKAGEDTGPGFGRLKEKFAALLKRQSEPGKETRKNAA
jgi:hypothetical protein